jgi:UDP-N-acetylmuramate dehydrogenase
LLTSSQLGCRQRMPGLQISNGIARVTPASSVPGNALNEAHRDALRDMLAGAVSFDEPLAPKTSMRVGGPAAAFATVKDINTLAALLKWATRESVAWTMLGLGSNVLVSDAGFPGLVIRLGGEFTRIAVTKTRLRAGGAAPIVSVCREAARAGLAGAEALVGIPGTIGGAVRMNAGTKVEIGDLVRRIEVIVAGEDAQTYTLPEFAYRTSTLDRRTVVCAAELELREGDTSSVQAELRRHIERRNATQPLELPNSGSIFRNPAGDYAARLIESAGCKGLRIGGAQVSEKHANFIVNRGGATCADVLALIEEMRETVKRTHGVDLELEVHIL